MVLLADSDIANANAKPLNPQLLRKKYGFVLYRLDKVKKLVRKSTGNEAVLKLREMSASEGRGEEALFVNQKGVKEWRRGSGDISADLEEMVVQGKISASV